MDISGKLMLAPMAGITDVAFRSLCVDFGADITVSELTSDRAILHGAMGFSSLLKRADNESFFGIQLFGSDPSLLSRAAKLVEPECDFIDINMGCPAPKVWSSGSGSALLEHPSRIHSIISSVCSAISLPVSAKIRTGISDHSLAGPALDACQHAGASWVTVHGRTRSQGYAGCADWSVIASLKRNHSLPLIGNGDITSPSDIASAFDCGVDAVAIGRGASGNPWLFSHKPRPVSFSERLDVLSEYLELASHHSISLLHCKLQAQHFMKGVEGAASLRQSLSRARSIFDIKRILSLR